MSSPEGQGTLRILIAEDVDLVAEAFEALLSTEPGFEVVGRVGRGDEVAAAVERLAPDVAVLDVDMPGMSGIEAAEGLTGCAVLLLTALEGPGHLHRALAAGANGYLLKSATGRRLVEAIRTVAAGGTAIDPDLAAEALRRGTSPLTAREVDILRLVGEGRSTDDIASALFLSRGTVRNYLSHAMDKLDARSRTEAFALAERRGWL
ncbi:response regulator transcription factor [Phycicoccus sp. MAQZ13P-2]|uniref:response regulator n=1 Tax=Phycicoccus mangrovi TaxID=2840470 RepID=UPI001C00403D|nr:response regulator transcription factor [Phycicoccus mangrovi]MBT9255606.1 response regulator transcription factor [Phycicoccus mangrovi]MBT9275320.1 response regulator transcription factor [Phycicoccus mangrovi]